MSGFDFEAQLKLLMNGDTWRWNHETSCWDRQNELIDIALRKARAEALEEAIEACHKTSRGKYACIRAIMSLKDKP